MSVLQASASSLTVVTTIHFHPLDTPITVFPSDIHKILTNLNVNKATGPDKIGISQFKNVADSISEPLCTIFNYSMQNNTSPSMWKKSNAIPLHRKKAPEDKKKLSTCIFTMQRV